MIQTITLIYALLIILLSIDDIIWEIYNFFKRIRFKQRKQEIMVKDLESHLPKLLAVVIAAYQEEDVLEKVIENIVASQQYYTDLYHIFIGVYPNDLKTQEIAQRLENKYPHIHAITHVLNGPSSKADNINNVIKNIYEFEKENQYKFQGIVIHDSEDVIHPYEFVLENYLFTKHSAVQIPVFPLQKMPKLSNMFSTMVSGTYADEFAENHYRTLTRRNAVDAFVPSAGTGFALRRNILESFKDHNIFPVGSLTEDFKLSLKLKKMGYHLYYCRGIIHVLQL